MFARNPSRALMHETFSGVSLSQGGLSGGSPRRVSLQMKLEGLIF